MIENNFEADFQNQIKEVHGYVKKKKISKARRCFMSLVNDVNTNLNRDMIPGAIKVSKLETTFQAIWKDGVDFNRPFEEWAMLMSIRYLHEGANNFDRARAYFLQWLALIKRYAKIHHQIPDLAMKFKDNLSYETLKSEDVLNRVNEILNCLKAKFPSRSYAFFTVIKAKMVQVLGLIDKLQYLELMKKAVWTFEQVSRHFCYDSFYFNSIMDVAHHYNIEHDFEKALKWQFKLYNLLQREPQTCKDFQIHWIDCLLGICTILLEIYSAHLKSIVCP